MQKGSGHHPRRRATRIHAALCTRAKTSVWDNKLGALGRGTVPWTQSNYPGTSRAVIVAPFQCVAETGHGGVFCTRVDVIRCNCEHGPNSHASWRRLVARAE